MSTKKVKAVKMWASSEMGGSYPLYLHNAEWEAAREQKNGIDPVMPYFLIPATAEAYEAMVEQMAKTIFKEVEDEKHPTLNWSEYFPCGLWRRRWLDRARKQLAALNITNPATKEKP